VNALDRERPDRVSSRRMPTPSHPLVAGPLALARRAWGRLVGPDVYVVFLEYGPAHRRTGREVLRRFLGYVFPGRPTREVVVDNAFARDEEVPPADGADVIAGDNSSREFSGFDAGVAFLRRKFQPSARSVFVLANDTFHRSYGTEYLDRFHPASVRAALRRGQAVGYVDCYPDEIEVLGLPVRCWIRTSLLVLGGRTLDAIGALALPVGDESIFASGPLFFRDDAPLSDNYKRYLRAWLFGEDGGDFNERWHSMKPLTPENVADFRGKTRSILCEHYVSARLRARGIEIFRVN
jgi:hypothetical protein